MRTQNDKCQDDDFVRSWKGSGQSLKELFQWIHPFLTAWFQLQMCEVLTALTVMIIISWDVVMCKLVDIY
jgi:hypothetical protein